MLKDITVVTAFFDIGRRNFKKIPRKTETYLKWFERWARIKNDLIVFCGNDLIKAEIIRIRTQYNLVEKTKIKVIEDIFAVESDMYQRMVSISNDPYFLNFRMEKDAPENIPEYNYINFLKSWFLKEASDEYDIHVSWMAWIDFGFDHGGKLYPHEDDWAFLWQCDCPEKVHLFYLPPKLEERPIFEVVRTLHPDSIMGPLILCPTSLSSKFWQINRESIYELLDIGLMDDDQLILLLSSRRNPALFELKKSWWFLPIKEMGGGHMRINADFLHPAKPAFVSRVIGKLKRVFLNKRS